MILSFVIQQTGCGIKLWGIDNSFTEDLTFWVEFYIQVQLSNHIRPPMVQLSIATPFFIHIHVLY